MEAFIHKLNAHIEEILVHRKINLSARNFDDFRAAYVTNKQTNSGVSLSADVQLGLYLACRMPGTVSALARIFSDFPGDFHPRTLCDLGSGSGSAIVASANQFQTLTHAIAVDSNPELMRLGEEIQTRMTMDIGCKYVRESYTSYTPEHTCDLVTLSYTLNEIPENKRLSVVANAWAQCTGFMVIVEPGSKAGFATIMQMRDWALAQGIHIYAPCSHRGVCPLRANDWCHFHARFPRSKRLLQVKRGSRGYEDEPYTYLVLSRKEYDPRGQRVLSMPSKIPQGLTVSLCAPEYVKEKIVPKKDTHFKHVKRLKAGQRYI